MLRVCAKLLRKSTRESDWSGRWGGEEFLSILTMSILEGGRIFASRLREAFENLIILQVPQVTANFWSQHGEKRGFYRQCHRACR